MSATPVYPAVTPATCTSAGALTVPTNPQNVTVTRTPETGSGPGTYTFTYAPTAGFTFPAGTATTKTVTVPDQKSGATCAEVAGVDENRGTPSKVTGVAKSTPRVLGTEAAVVPTAVDAVLGVSRRPTCGCSSDRPSSVAACCSSRARAGRVSDDVGPESGRSDIKTARHRTEHGSRPWWLAVLVLSW